MLQKRELDGPHYNITKVITPYTSLMAWQWFCFLLASNTWQVTRACTPHCVKLKVTASHPHQILLNQTLLHKFEKCCQLSRCIKAKSLKERLACTTFVVNSGPVSPEEGGTMIPQNAVSTSPMTSVFSWPCCENLKSC